MSILRCYVLLLLVPLLAAPARADLQPVFDTSALDAFWPIVEILEQDLDPPVEMWDALFESPAHRVLVDEGMTPVYFERLLALVFRPSLRASRETARSDPQSAAAIEHFVQTWEQRERVDRAARELARRGLSDALLTELRQLLPAELPDGRPNVALVVWANAGRGGDPILVDPLSIATWDVPAYIAHEMHHRYRDRLLAYDRTKVQTDDRAIVTWLEALQAEGIADQIDKHRWIEGTAPIDAARQNYVRRYQHALEHIADEVSALDASLTSWNAAGSEGERRRAGDGLGQELELGGHPLGYSMTRTILDTFGKDRLLASIGNPFAFARTYDEAARRAGRARPLSDEAMAALQALEKKYVAAKR
jgi:hypothetical protein